MDQCRFRLRAEKINKLARNIIGLFCYRAYNAHRCSSIKNVHYVVSSCHVCRVNCTVLLCLHATLFHDKCGRVCGFF